MLDSDVPPYATSLEHLLAELARIDLLLRVQLDRRLLQPAHGEGPGRELHLSEESTEALLASAGETERRGQPSWVEELTLAPQVAQALAQVAERLAASKSASLACGRQLRLPTLCRLFELSPLDADVLMVCLAPELDLRYERLFAFLQGDAANRRPSVDLTLNLLAGSFAAKLAAQERFLPAAPLIRHHLIEVVDDPTQPRSPLLGRYLKLDERIHRYLLGSDELDAELGVLARCLVPRPQHHELVVAPTLRAAVGQVAEQAARGPLLIHLRGPQGVGKSAFAEAIAGALGRRLLIVDGELLVGAGSAAYELLLCRAAREARLQGALLYVRGFDALLGTEQRPMLRALLARLAQGSEPAFVAGAREWEPTTSQIEILPLTFPRPAYAERLASWTSALGPTVSAEVAAELPALASKFRHTHGEIAAAVASARGRARGRGAETAGLTVADLYLGCRAQSSLNLAELAKKINPQHAWQDLVLQSDVMEQLREICNHARYRTQVFETWGFERRLSLGRGLAALFAGQSGTGKTMAAEVMASELGLDLYKIALSGIVSKYIGETEKNLARVFREAETTSAILFFDEADALFGKRSEVKDAHDRYANVETSYLLQQMEEYQGITILATNLRRHMDDAFLRRLSFVVQFPLPEEAERLRLWQGMLPRELPREADVDLEFLARQFKLPGGNIKNIALGAAFLAASEGCAMAMRHLVRATRRELMKMGKSFAASEMGSYAGLLED